MHFRHLLAPAFLLTSALSTHADVIYNLTLTATNPDGSGSGTLTLNTAPPSNTYTQFVSAADAAGAPKALFPYRIETLTVTFLGNTYILDPQHNAIDAYFLNGSFYILDAYFANTYTSLAFGNESFGGLGGPHVFEFYNGLTYTMYTGDVEATLASATPTPEPATLALLGTGLLGLFLTRRTLA